MTFKALLASRIERTVSVDLVEMSEDQLMAGDVSIDVDYSTVNYKDGLAMAGRPGVIQTWPLIPGIDLAGTVTASDHAGFAPGDRVVLNGWGLSQTHHGGYAQKARVSGDWLIKLLPDFLLRETKVAGKFGLRPLLPVNADGTINTGTITPAWSLTEAAIIPDSFQLEYAEASARRPVAMALLWRQQ
ncbi:MAG: hypothetical protein EBS42_12585, partial [Caulobacteraceae bacterium]|nr:hypothetical protein [Caulobacteraceae bacterium]